MALYIVTILAAPALWRGEEAGGRGGAGKSNLGNDTENYLKTPRSTKVLVSEAKIYR